MATPWSWGNLVAPVLRGCLKLEGFLSSDSSLYLQNVLGYESIKIVVPATVQRSKAVLLVVQLHKQFGA